MTLAIFDLDHTLLDGDSDYLWGEYMVAHQIVDEARYRRRNEIFYADYRRGDLDNDRYLEFCLQPLTMHPLESLHNWRSDFVENWIKPIVAPGYPPIAKPMEAPKRIVKQPIPPSPKVISCRAPKPLRGEPYNRGHLL